ncbi:MAG: amidase [Chloroflexota bacterium]|nr:amidase [Chloroflexota bacterium]
MSPDDLAYARAVDIARWIRGGELTARAAVTASLDRIEAEDARLHAFVDLAPERALAAAAEADAAVSRGDSLGPLHGVPVAIKVQVQVRGMAFHRGSRLFADDVGERDAPAVERLKRAGAIIVGMTAMPEFGHLAFAHNPMGPTTRNPWSHAHTCGGSSSGSAVALAAGYVPLVLGSDGGGSIRIPASCCGVFGIKPSLGRVPYVPIVGGRDAVSHLGPMARSAADMALGLAVIAGPHDADLITLPPDEADYREAAVAGVDGARVAWAPQLGADVVDAEVVDICTAALDAFRAAGCEIASVEPMLSDATREWATLFTTLLAAQVGHRMDEVRAVSEASLLAAAEAGLAVSGMEMMAAGSARRRLWDEMADLFARHDVVVTPTLLMPPLPIDEPGGRPADPNVWAQRWFRHVYPFNMTGQPAATVPAGITRDGLPVGLQIVGARHADADVLRFAAAFDAHWPQARLEPPDPES